MRSGSTALLLLVACKSNVPEHSNDVAADAGAAGGGGASGTLLPSPDCKQPLAKAQCESDQCRIEAGCFVMGAPKQEWGRGAISSTQVQVTITRPFEMSRTEVTRAQWEDLGLAQPTQHFDLGEGPCVEPDCPQGDVSFFDALEFANRYSAARGLPACYELGGCSGEFGNELLCTSVHATAPSVYDCSGYRLPTEAEYEYAARAGATTGFYSGDAAVQPDFDCYPDPNLELIGWYCYNSEKRAHPVAGKQPNAWGLFDMSGNVEEWCNDVYKPLGYGTGPLVDPTGMPRTGPDLAAQPDEDRVTRSGDFIMPAYISKHNWHTSYGDDAFAPNIGIRLVRTLSD